REAAILAAGPNSVQRLALGKSCEAKRRVLRVFRPSPHGYPQVWKGVCRRPSMRLRACGLPSSAGTAPGPLGAHLYWCSAALRPFPILVSREANVPAERAPAEAPARIPGADVHARWPRDPEAPPGQGTQAALGLIGAE